MKKLGAVKYILSQKELDKIKEDLKNQVVHDIAKYDVEVLLSCFALVLRDNQGWGHKRILNTISAIDDLFGKVLSGEISDLDLREQLKEKTGIVINYSGGDIDGFET